MIRTTLCFLFLVLGIQWILKIFLRGKIPTGTSICKRLEGSPDDPLEDWEDLRRWEFL